MLVRVQLATALSSPTPWHTPRSPAPSLACSLSGRHARAQRSEARRPVGRYPARRFSLVGLFHRHGPAKLCPSPACIAAGEGRPKAREGGTETARPHPRSCLLTRQCSLTTLHSPLTAPPASHPPPAARSVVRPEPPAAAAVRAAPGRDSVPPRSRTYGTGSPLRRCRTHCRRVSPESPGSPAGKPRSSGGRLRNSASGSRKGPPR